MRHIIVLIFMWGSMAYSQIDINAIVHKELKEVRELYEYLKKAFEAEPTVLVPFMEDGKYGYLDFQTLEIVIPPVADRLVLLNTVFKNGFIGELDGYYLEFDGKENLTFKQYGPPQVREELPPADWGLPADLGAKMIPKNQKFKGFTYTRNEEGKIYVSSFSEIFDSKNSNDPNLWLIEMEGKVYGIGEIWDFKNSQKLAGIISPDGKPLKGFDFSFDKILPLKGLKESLGNWFLVRKSYTEDSRFHFVNSKGEFLSETILPKLDYSYNFTKTRRSTPYYIPKGSLRYGMNDNKIVDLY